MPVRIVGGELRFIPLSHLVLDWENPRLPEDMQRPDVTQVELAAYIDKNFDPLRVAESIAKHGFFVSEPLIAIPDGGRRVRVVEGNRRLAALLGLSRGEIRELLRGQTRGWGNLEEFDTDIEVPVVLVENRAEVDALLGFRHISGIEPWDPFAQARFVARLLSENDGDFDVVAERVGRDVSTVRAMYRDYDVVEQARHQFGLDTSRVEKAFGVFNAAMGIVNIRSYIGAPAPRHVDPEYYPVSEESRDNVKRLFTYLFGDDRGRGRVVHDSRHLRKLGRVLADGSGAAEAELRRSGDLDQAVEATVTRAERVRGALERASGKLTEAVSFVTEDGIDPAALRPLVDRCGELVEELSRALEEHA